jgi:hypothetical protein
MLSEKQKKSMNVNKKTLLAEEFFSHLTRENTFSRQVGASLYTGEAGGGG